MLWDDIRNRFHPALKQQQLVKDAKVNPQAYEPVLKGRFYRGKGSREGHTKAVKHFNQAIAIDGDYALAYAELAATYRQLAADSLMDPKEATPMAEAGVRKALELDDGLAEANSALADIKANAWDWTGAEQEYKHSDPYCPGCLCRTKLPRAEECGYTLLLSRRSLLWGFAR